MTSTTNVILDLSPDVQELVERQQIDLYREIQEELHSVRLEAMSDPAAPGGSKDIVTVIVATTGLITALTPLVIRILNQYKPDTTEIMHEETEDHHPDGTLTIHRLHVYTKREYNQQMQLPRIQQKPELPSPGRSNDSNQTSR
jgi:hypothetical protein